MISVKKEKRYLILPVVGLLFSALFLEILFRVLPNKITQIDFSIRNLKYYFTPTRNAYKPFVSFPYNWLGGNNTIWHFNNIGFRDRPVSLMRNSSKVESTYRIVSIGDSVTMGAGVEEWEAFPSQTEKLLQFKTSSSETTYFEAINLGIPGYGTTQYEEVMREVAVKLHPDMVIIGFLPFQDPIESAFSEANKKYNYLRSLPDTVLSPKINIFLINHSYLYLAFLSRYYGFINRYDIVFEDFIKTASREELENRGWNISRQLIKSMKDLADKNNIKFVIVGIPWSEDVFMRRTDTYMPRLKSIANEYNINFIDLSSAIASYPKYRDLFINGSDIHFTTIGHQTVAYTITKYLRDQKLVPVEQ